LEKVNDILSANSIWQNPMRLKIVDCELYLYFSKGNGSTKHISLLKKHQVVPVIIYGLGHISDEFIGSFIGISIYPLPIMFYYDGIQIILGRHILFSNRKHFIDA
jgi:hypothetical protein